MKIKTMYAVGWNLDATEGDNSLAEITYRTCCMGVLFRSPYWSIIIVYKS